MARLDVYSRPAGSESQFLLEVQADLLWRLATRAVVPLVSANTFRAIIPELNPVFEVNGERVVMLTQAIATVPSRDLRNRVANLISARDAVVRALDILLVGF